MAAVDPYSPCPCGSGQKFKWCCLKVEPYAERAERLFRNGQVELAIEAVEEGLRKVPGNPWLLLNLAHFQIQTEQNEDAEVTLRELLAKNPKNDLALIQLPRLVLETEGAEAAAAELQQALMKSSPSARPYIATLAQLLGSSLGEDGHYPAALRHLALAVALKGQGSEGRPLPQAAMIEGNPGVSPWLKNPDRLSGPPEGLSGPWRERFEQALRWAEEGLWSSAAAAFESLSSEEAARFAADRNLGLCRLWMGDEAGAVPPLRRCVARLGESTEAVDLEALCQQVQPIGPDDMVDHVQLIWPLRNREALLQRLRSDATVVEDESRPIDLDDPESPVVEQFALLDRPAIKTRSGLRRDEVPVVLGRLLVGQEIVALESFDDGRLDGVSDRVIALAGDAVPPAHPRTKEIQKISRLGATLAREERHYGDLDKAEAERLSREVSAWLMQEVWPRSPMSYLGGRTPLRAAQDRDAVVPLRAALSHLESRGSSQGKFDFAALRAKLGIGPEPEVDPGTVNIEDIHLARLARVPLERLDDDRLVAIFLRADRYGITDVVERSARLLVSRPEVCNRPDLGSFVVHTALASSAASRGDVAEAIEWVRRGRQAEPGQTRASRAVDWDIFELRLRARTEPPESWVPELAVLLERYRQDDASNQKVVMSLLDMGLIRMAPHPERADQVLLDSRPLQALMAHYGPRVTTASGSLGVAATRGGIWTPGSEGGAGGGLWTPGAASAARPAGEKAPKLILPDR